MNGWQEIEGRKVYVRNGYVTRCKKLDLGEWVSAAVYRWEPYTGVWQKLDKVEVDAFRAGIKAEVIEVI